MPTMNTTAPISPVNHDARITESLARETDASIEVVRILYAEEVSALRAGAKIQQYVGVLASRRVKQRLQQQPH